MLCTILCWSWHELCVLDPALHSMLHCRDRNKPSQSLKFHNHGKGSFPTQAFSWLKAPTTTFTLKTNFLNLYVNSLPALVHCRPLLPWLAGYSLLGRQEKLHNYVPRTSASLLAAGGAGTLNTQQSIINKHWKSVLLTGNLGLFSSTLQLERDCRRSDPDNIVN